MFGSACLLRYSTGALRSVFEIGGQTAHEMRQIETEIMREREREPVNSPKYLH